MVPASVSPLIPPVSALCRRHSRLGSAHRPCEQSLVAGAKAAVLGFSVGARPFPTSTRTRAIETESVSEADYDFALWAVIYKNPAAELQLLALRPLVDIPPGRDPPGAELERRLRSMDTGFAELAPEQRAALRALLDADDLLLYFEKARDIILDLSSFRDAMQTAVEPVTDYRLAVARALIACAYQVRCDEQQLAEGDVFLDGSARDQAVELLVAALGGREASPAEWVKAEAGRLVSGIGSRWFGRRRGRLSDQFAPFGADVIAYQARPAAIRGFIRNAVAKASAGSLARGEDGKVALLAHSLGGIAAFEMLVEGPPLDAIDCVITVGSQVPLLYELDALEAFRCLAILREGSATTRPLYQTIFHGAGSISTIVVTF